MPLYTSNKTIEDNFAIHKTIDSSFDEFSLNYSNYLHKKTTEGYPNFFTSSKQIEHVSEKNIVGKSADWIAGFIVLAFAILVFSRHFFYRRFSMLTSAFGSIRLFNQFVKEGNIYKERISLPLFIATILIISLFAYETIEYFQLTRPFTVSDLTFFLIITACVIVIYLSKILIKSLVGLLFKTKIETFEHLSSVYIFDTISALSILPITIIQSYNTKYVLFIIGAAIISLIFILRLIRLIGIGLSKSKFSGYYLFLYLCSVEILPVVVFAKLAIVFFNIEI